MDIALVVLSIFLSIFIYYLFGWLSNDKVRKLVDEIPGPTKLPFIGTIHNIIFIPKEDIWRSTINILSSYAPIARTWIGNTPTVHLLSPENIEQVLNSSIHIKKSFIYDGVQPWLGEGLLTSTGKKWHMHRKLITPTFHFSILENFMEVFVEKSKVLVKQLQSTVKEDVFDLYPYITRCALDIICETAMGIEINAMSHPENEYVKNIYNITKATAHRFIKPWLHSDFIYYRTNEGKQYRKYITALHNFTSKVIKERKEALISETNTNRKTVEDEILDRKAKKAFLDMLLEMRVGFSDEELREEVDTFMFAGHDTTTTGICWSLFLLGNHPQIQEEVFQEIKTTFEESKGNLTISNLGNLKLLERCIKEALRLYPNVPNIGRKLTQDLTLEKYTVPAGCNVSMPIYILHRDEKIYPNPDKFDPDRFLPENIKKRHPYAYIPFSAGPRNCIGQKFAMYEEKTLLAYILKNYKVTAVEDQQTVKPMMEIILRPKNGLLVKLVRRDA